MSRKLRLALIGAGNVMKARHLPALRRNADLFDVRGVVDLDPQRAREFAEAGGVPNHGAIESADGLCKLDWFGEVDAVIIGVPPQKHHEAAKACLSAGKHVLVEKPFAVTVGEARELTALAAAKGLILAVDHNFQYARSFLKVDGLLKSGELGRLQSIYCVQLTNYSRRIPSWTEELPFGLFYDESPHYFYLTRRFTGDDIRVMSAYQSRSALRTATPEIMSLNLESAGIPISVYWNFDSPVCEWYFTLLGEKKLAAVDLFRDILIVLPNDTPHYAYQIMRTSLLSTFQHWRGVAVNGLSYLQNKLYYGLDVVQQRFHRAVTSNDARHIDGMSGEDGLFVTEIQNRIVAQLESNG